MTNLKIHPFLIFLIVFIIALIWTISLTQGLPLGDPDDWDHVLAASDLSWNTLLGNLITPWSSSALWSGQVGRMNEVLHRRLFRSVILKTSENLFGFQSFPFYFLSKNIFFAGTVGILFLLLLKLTNSLPISIGGMLFYVFVPAHYTHLLWISDPDTMVHFFMLLSIFSYLQFVSQDHSGKPKNWNYFLIFFISGWLAMKTKESALILPLSVGLYSVIQAVLQKQIKKEHACIMFTCLLLCFFIVPLNALKSSAPPQFAFNLQVLSRLIFRNYACGYEDEAVSAFFSTKSIWPVSIARTFGFFMLWTLIGFGLFYFFKRRTQKETLLKQPLVVISCLWVIIWTFFAGTFQPDPRYFSGVMVPLVILAAALAHRTISIYQKPWKIILILAICGSLYMTLFENIQHVYFLRILIGQRTNRFLNIAKTIFEDRYGKSDLSEIGRFYSAEYIRDPDRQKRLKNSVYFVEMGYGQWEQTSAPSASEFERLAQKGFTYAAVMNRDQFNGSSRIKLIQTIDGINHRSVLENILYTLKRKSPAPMYVFKYA